MRIYKIHLEHKTEGKNFSSQNVSAMTCEEAIKKVKRDLIPILRVESVELLADTED